MSARDAITRIGDLANTPHLCSLGAPFPRLQFGLVVLSGMLDLQAAVAASFPPTVSLTTARNNHPATLLPNGKVLVAGAGEEGWNMHGASCEGLARSKRIAP